MDFVRSNTMKKKKRFRKVGNAMLVFCGLDAFAN